MPKIHWCNNEGVSNDDDDYDDDNNNNNEDDDDNDDNDSKPTELLKNRQTASLEENQGCVMICFTVKFYL
jgi:hypothetical protein